MIRRNTIRARGRAVARLVGTGFLAIALLTPPGFLPAQEEDGPESPMGGGATVPKSTTTSPVVQKAPAPGSQTGDPGARLVNAVFQGAKIDTVLTVLTNQAGVNITPFGQVPGQQISILARDEPLEAVLNKIAQPKGWIWFKTDDGGYGLADEGWYKQNILPTKVITKIFRPDHIKASELEKAIRPMLTQGISSATADDRTNKLIVTDLAEIIERIERLIREIDVQLFTRVFYIRYADINDIAEKIEAYKSDPGTIEVDEKTHQIIVSDLLANIKKMELLIDILDVGPEIRIYDVNNVGLEGEDLEDLETIIEDIRTPDLLFEVNEKQGVFILEDVPEVHERVEQILEGFDRPIKQVLIQGEIISSTFTRTFELGWNSFVLGDEITPIETVTVGGGASGFTGITTKLPYASLLGDTITGAYLGNEAYLEYQATFSDTTSKVLLQPRLLVKNQETSSIFVGREEPFLTTYFNDNTNNTGSTRSTSQSTVTDGLTFDVTPSISNSYLVELELAIDNDDAQIVNRISGGEITQLVARDRQSVETVLTIPSGQTRVIGGLLTNSTSDSQGGVPFLSKIPYLGALFGSQSTTKNKTNLQLFITPTIVEDTIPRATSEDGKRGRLVTGYERVPGSYDLDVTKALMDDAVTTGTMKLDKELLSSDPDMEGALEDLLRDNAPRQTGEAPVDESTNWRPKATGGSASIGGEGGGSTRPPRVRPERPPTDGQPVKQPEQNGGGINQPVSTGGGGLPPASNPGTETKYN